MSDMDGQFVVEVEKDRTRTLYGPFHGSDAAMGFAVEMNSDTVKQTLVKKLIDPYGPVTASVPSRPEPHIHPDQTTISDHIDDIHDAVG